LRRAQHYEAIFSEGRAEFRRRDRGDDFDFDTHTEIVIQNALKRLLEGRTSIVIAHRLSTIRNADMIVVLDQGCIVEMGKHAELLQRKGRYARLYAVNYGLSQAHEAPTGDSSLNAQTPAADD
jgi:ABC-type multidrug transport system ATPase subunit